MQSPIINLDQVIKNMSELNHLVTENEREVEYDGNGGARFNRAAVVAVTFYLDGFTVDRGRFRSYAETASQTFLKDLTDGFFPAEMQVLVDQCFPILLLNDDIEVDGRLLKDVLYISMTKQVSRT